MASQPAPDPPPGTRPDPWAIATTTCWRCGFTHAALWHGRVACGACGLFWAPLPGKPTGP